VLDADADEVARCDAVLKAGLQPGEVDELVLAGAAEPGFGRVEGGG